MDQSSKSQTVSKPRVILMLVSSLCISACTNEPRNTNTYQDDLELNQTAANEPPPRTPSVWFPKPLPERIQFCSTQEKSKRREYWNWRMGGFTRCNDDFAIAFEARSSFPDGKVGAYYEIWTPSCGYQNDSVVRGSFPRAFFRHSQNDQPLEALTLLRSAAEQLPDNCIGNTDADIDQLLDERMLERIHELSDFWHWTDRQIAIGVCREETGRPQECIDRYNK